MEPTNKPQCQAARDYIAYLQADLDESYADACGLWLCTTAQSTVQMRTIAEIE